MMGRDSLKRLTTVAKSAGAPFLMEAYVALVFIALTLVSVVASAVASVSMGRTGMVSKFSPASAFAKTASCSFTFSARLTMLYNNDSVADFFSGAICSFSVRDTAKYCVSDVLYCFSGAAVPSLMCLN